MTEIIASTDLSTTGRAATKCAAALHDRTHIPVTLLHAVEPPPLGVLSPFVPFGTDRNELVDDLRQHAAVELERRRDRHFSEEDDVALEVRVGKPARVIRSVADAHEDALVVIGSHGFGALRRLFAGSVADDVVSACERDVLVVPPAPTDAPAFAGARRVMIVTDAAHDVAHLASRAELLAQPEATLQLLRVVPSATPTPFVAVDDVTDPDALRLLEEQIMELRLQRAWSTVTGGMAQSASPAETIAQRAEEQAIDLVVMPAPPRARLEQIVTGKSPGGLMHLLSLPCLFVAPHRATAAPVAIPIPDSTEPVATAWATPA